MKVLFLLTDRFPFGHGEPFLEAEFPYLKKAFDKIHIITTRYENLPIRSNFSENGNIVINPCLIDQEEIKRKPLKIIAGMRYLFSRLVIKEIGILLGTSSPSMFLHRLRSALFSRIIAESIFCRIVPYLSTEILETSKVCLYSYWTRNGALAALKIKRKYPQVCFISRAHRIDLYSERSSIDYIPYQKQILDTVDKIFLISSHGRNYLADKFRDARSKMEVFRLGTFDQGVPKFRRNNSVLRVVSCSALVPVKRIDLLVEALSRIKTILIDWIHIGDGPERKRITSLISEKLVGTNVNARLLGQLSNRDVLKFYFSERVDILINVSESEGLPVSMMEAMSFGIPVVGTNVGGVSEIIDENTGILMSACPTSVEVAETIVSFHSLADSKRESLSKNARKRWKQYYNAETNYGRFVQRIVELCELER